MKVSLGYGPKPPSGIGPGVRLEVGQLTGEVVVVTGAGVVDDEEEVVVAK